MLAFFTVFTFRKTNLNLNVKTKRQVNVRSAFAKTRKSVLEIEKIMCLFI